MFAVVVCAGLVIAGAHAARAVGVVGNGTLESCTEAALDGGLADGGTVTFDCGAEPVTITVTSTKTISADTVIDGESLITISGGNSVGVFAVNAGVTFAVENLTIANGSANCGGGILNDGTLAVTNSTFSGNNSGAISNFGGLVVIDSTFSGNSADEGGAISGGGTLTVTNSIITNSTSGGNCGGSMSDGGHNIADDGSCGFTGTSLSG